MKELGEKIKMLREEKGLSENELAEILNVSWQSIRNWEKGNSRPRLIHLVKVAKFFNVKLDFLLGFKKTRN